MDTGMTAIRVILAAALAASALWAGQLSGRWTAEVEGRHGVSMALTIDMQEQDGVLTGTVRGPRGENPISSGTVDGDEISFTVVTDFDGYQIRQHYRGTHEGDVIHFSLQIENGRSRAAALRDFDAKRVS
jgi:hypothetical protein